MGLLNSRIIEYESAVDRCSPKEVARWSRGFQRFSSKDKNVGNMDKQAFITSVLGGNVPPEIAERIYRVFANSQNEGLSLKEFICGMVIFLKGTPEEKIRFVFNVYDIEDTGYISKEEMEKVLVATNTSEDSRKKIIQKCFKNTSHPGKLLYKEWKKWVADNRRSDLPLIGWIYEHKPPKDEDSDTEDEEEESDSNLEKNPSDLAKVTHFSEDEIAYLSKQYEKLLKDRPYGFQAKGNQLDRGTIMRLFCPPLPDELAYNLFNAFVDEGQESVNLENFLCGLSVCCRGSPNEKLKFIFKVFDKDKDDKLTKTEFHNMIQLLWRIETTVLNQKANKEKEQTPTKSIPIPSSPLAQSGSPRSLKEKDKNQQNQKLLNVKAKKDNLSKSATYKLEIAPNPAEVLVDHAFLEKSLNRKKEQTEASTQADDEFITLEEYLQWTQTDNIASQCLAVLKRIANVNIGLPPSSKKEEKDLIKHYIQTAKRHRAEGDVMYVIAAKWWYQWTSYVCYNEDDDGDPLDEGSRPGMIDNASVYVKQSRSWSILSYFSDSHKLNSETPKLKPGLKENHDYYLVPIEAWKALVHWYGCSCYPLQCKVISAGFHKKLEVEVYPLHIVFKLEPPAQFPKKTIEYAKFPFSRTTVLQDVKRKACMQIGVSTMTKIRLWSMDKDVTVSLEDKLEETLEDAKIMSGQTIILERQLKDGTWPRGGKEEKEEQKPIYPIVPGISGLRNLGNTCFMNSSLQCLSNTPVLTPYFTTNRYLKEINKDNPLGMNGHVAKEYGSLIKEMWPTDPEKKSVTKNYVVAPKDLKWVIGKFAPQFSDFRQQDAQEFLSFLLDGLHEDLNRVIKKPYTQNPDYEGQPDDEFSQTFWEIYLKRNRSIIVDMFHGQFKSTISFACGSQSVTFDPMTFLSLPLPIDEKRAIEVYFFYIEKQERPLKVSVLVDREDGTVNDLMKGLSDIVKVPLKNIILSTVENGYIFNLIYPWGNMKTVGDVLYAYEVIGCPPNLKEPKKTDIIESVKSKENPKESHEQNKSKELEKSNNSNDIIEEKSEENSPQDNDIIYLRVLNRKVQKNKIYFITPYSTSLFSSPTILSFSKKSMTNRKLYEKIAQHLKFMIEPKNEESEAKKKTSSDSSDSEIGSSQYPFVINLVNVNGTSCSRTPWYDFKIGTPIPVDDEPLDVSNDEAIAVDWKIEVKNYHKNSQHGDWFDEHKSVPENWEKLNKPISLDQCINWFTQDENLPDEIVCSKCKKPEKTKKKLQIWKPPKILILHLKRFAFYNNRWIKSNRLVEFPINDLDVSKWLVEVPESPMIYDLYATVNHFGRLGGGHYTAHAKNFNENKWYNFDDSSAKPIEKEEELVNKSSYLLFYKIRDLKENEILTGEAPDIEEIIDVGKVVGKLPQKDENGYGKSAQSNCACM